MLTNDGARMRVRLEVGSSDSAMLGKRRESCGEELRRRAGLSQGLAAPDTLVLETMRIVLALLAAMTNISGASDHTYKGVEVVGGQLFIKMTDGTKITAPKIKDQVGFEGAAVSGDGRTAGWLMDFPDPFVPGNSPLAGALAIYRSGRIIQTFAEAAQVIWSWRFADRGLRVAYCSGPTHGGASECKLVDDTSGKMLGDWMVSDKTPPSWAKGLRY